MEFNKFELNNASFNFREAINDTISMMRHKTHSRQIQIFKKISDQIPTYINGDKKRISQVFLNLLSNAVKFSRQNGKIEIFIKRIPFLP